jgi:hypothetical protein
MRQLLAATRDMLAALTKKINEARLLWPDSVALGVFLSFVMGLSMVLWPTYAHNTAHDTLAVAYPASIALLGTIFLLTTLWAVLVPLYGGLGATLVYGAFSLVAMVRDFNPVFIGLWIVWILFALHGSYVRLAELHRVQQRWDDVLQFHAANTQMVPFYLLRLQDVSGVSGTGIVAEGCLFSNGQVSLTWVSDTQISTMTHFPSLDAVRAIHGHGGKTIIAWADPRLLPPEVRTPLVPPPGDAV